MADTQTKRCPGDNADNPAVNENAINGEIEEREVTKEKENNIAMKEMIIGDRGLKEDSAKISSMGVKGGKDNDRNGKVSEDRLKGKEGSEVDDNDVKGKVENIENKERNENKTQVGQGNDTSGDSGANKESKEKAMNVEKEINEDKTKEESKTASGESKENPKEEEVIKKIKNVHSDTSAGGKTEDAKTQETVKKSDETKDVKNIGKENPQYVKTKEKPDENKDVKIKEKTDDNKDVKTKEKPDENKDVKVKEKPDENKDVKVKEKTDENKDLKVKEKTDENKDVKTIGKEKTDENKDVKTKDKPGDSKDVKPKEKAEINKDGKANEKTETNKDDKAKEKPETNKDDKAKEKPETKDDKAKEKPETKDDKAKEKTETNKDDKAKEKTETNSDDKAKEKTETNNDDKAKEKTETNKDDKVKEETETNNDNKAKEKTETNKDDKAKEKTETNKDDKARERQENKNDYEAKDKVINEKPTDYKESDFKQTKKEGVDACEIVDETKRTKAKTVDDVYDKREKTEAKEKKIEEEEEKEEEKKEDAKDLPEDLSDDPREKLIKNDSADLDNGKKKSSDNSPLEPKESIPLNNKDAEERRSTTKEGLPARWITAILGCVGFMVVYGLKVNLSVAIIAMVNHTAVASKSAHHDEHHEEDHLDDSSNSTSTVSECGVEEKKEDLLDGPFIWDENIQGLILASYFYGYIFTQVPGGWVAEKFSAKHVFGFGALANAILALLTPLASKGSYIWLIIIRVGMGIAGGVTLPGMHVLIASWAPPQERSKIASTIYAGMTLGTLVCMPFSGILAAALGWESIFYVQGGLSILWYILWLIFVYDSPAKHPRISVSERKFIEESLGTVAKAEKLPVPWKSVWTSLPVWAIIVAHTCSNWGWYMLLVKLPTYMRYILKFDIKSNAGISAVPFLCMWIFTMLLANILDALRSRKIITTTFARKFATFIASIPPAGCLIAVTYVGCNTDLAVALLTLGTMFVGGMYSGFLSNHIDIAPPFAGTLMGISNTFATVPGIVVPSFVGFMTHGNQTVEAWRTIFFITLGIFGLEAVFFSIFGSGEEQPWARPKPRSDPEEQRLNEGL